MPKLPAPPAPHALAGISPDPLILRAGASMAINTGRRDRARQWSRAVYDAYPHIEGLWYASSWYASSMYANQPAFAFYERVEESLAQTPFFHMPLSAPGLYAALDGI